MTQNVAHRFTYSIVWKRILQQHVHHCNCTRTRTRTSDVRVCKIYFTHVHKHTAYALNVKWMRVLVMRARVWWCMEHLLMEMMTVTERFCLPTTTDYRTDMEYFFFTHTHTCKHARISIQLWTIRVHIICGIPHICSTHDYTQFTYAWYKSYIVDFRTEHSTSSLFCRTQREKLIMMVSLTYLFCINIVPEIQKLRNYLWYYQLENTIMSLIELELKFNCHVAKWILDSIVLSYELWINWYSRRIGKIHTFIYIYQSLIK